MWSVNFLSCEWLPSRISMSVWPVIAPFRHFRFIIRELNRWQVCQDFRNQMDQKFRRNSSPSISIGAGGALVSCFSALGTAFWQTARPVLPAIVKVVVHVARSCLSGRPAFKPGEGSKPNGRSLYST